MLLLQSYDETSHFHTAAEDVLDIYFRVTGEQVQCALGSIQFAMCHALTLPAPQLDMSIDPNVPQPGDY